MANQFSDFWLSEDGVEEVFRGDEETSQRFLEKPIERVFEAGSPGEPGYPGRPFEPAREAYCADVRVQRTVSETEFIPVSEDPPSGANFANVSPVVQQVFDPSLGTFTGELTGWLVTYSKEVTVTRERCYDARPARPAIPPRPATPPTPGKWKIDKRLGWNAGARSRKKLDGDLNLQFFVRPATGTAVGLAADKAGNHYRVLPHCLVFREGSVFAYEGGELVFGPVDYDPELRYGITRVNGEIKYTKNFVPFFTSGKESTGRVAVVSLLYAGGDRVI